MNLPADFDPLASWRAQQSHRAETRSFADRLKWDNKFWERDRDDRSTIASTWPAFEAACRVWGLPRTPVETGFTESR